MRKRCVLNISKEKKMKKILVTGGLGYIGSHTVVQLMQDPEVEVVIVDNECNSNPTVLDGIFRITQKIPKCIVADIRDANALRSIFANHAIDGIIHFAALKSVGESVKHPLEYYDTNVCGLVTLLQECPNVPFIFSSSCTVYGTPTTLPITESSPVQPALSPYGQTKIMGETIIKDAVCSGRLDKAVLLRYFNPIGAHDSLHIGEQPREPQNVVPILVETAAKKRERIQIFGNTYNTPDGTCIRDYIHVMDLVDAHIEALRWVQAQPPKTLEIFNIGTGQGVSVLTLIQTFEKVNHMDIPFEVVEKRQGDVPVIYADTFKANTMLGWKSQRTLEQALQSAWQFFSRF